MINSEKCIVRQIRTQMLIICSIEFIFEYLLERLFLINHFEQVFCYEAAASAALYLINRFETTFVVSHNNAFAFN